jgi:hypothetical protein
MGRIRVCGFNVANIAAVILRYLSTSETDSFQWELGNIAIAMLWHHGNPNEVADDGNIRTLEDETSVWTHRIVDKFRAGSHGECSKLTRRWKGSNSFASRRRLH